MGVTHYLLPVPFDTGLCSDFPPPTTFMVRSNHPERRPSLILYYLHLYCKYDIIIRGIVLYQY